MNVNDRIALEIGRAVLAKILAETQRDELLAVAAEKETKTQDPQAPEAPS